MIQVNIKGHKSVRSAVEIGSVRHTGAQGTGGHAEKHEFQPPAGHRRNSAKFYRTGACVVLYLLMATLSISEIAFCTSRRVGEADHPGPYFTGGASSSSAITAAANAETRVLVPSAQAEIGDEDAVPPSLRWPIPVIRRDTNYFHQSATELMHPDVISDFLDDELYGEEWCEQTLEQRLAEIYQTGRGHLDPADLLIDGNRRQELLDHDRSHGFADAIIPEPSFAATFCPRPADYLHADLRGEFLQQMAKKESNPSASAMMSWAATRESVIQLPTIVEEPHFDMGALGELAQTGAGQHTQVMVETLQASYVSTPVVQQHSSRRGRKTFRCRPAHSGTAAIQEAVTTGRSRPTEKRSRRTRARTSELVLLNSSGKPQLLSALQSGIRADVIINQEHHCTGPGFVDLKHDAHTAGWKLVGAAATRTTKGGTSGGVSIAAKNGIGVGDVCGSFDHSGKFAPGRIAAAWTHMGPDTGMVIFSVYLFHTEGPTKRNKDILCRALSIAKAYGSPWLIAGDFNMPPGLMLHSWGAMIELADAYVVAPSEETHRPRGSAHQILDYVVCSSSLLPWIKNISVDLGLEASPHRAVRIALDVEPKNYLIAGMKKPKQIPRERPIGCARCPVLPDWAEPTHINDIQACLPLQRGEGGHVSVQEGEGRWPALAHAMEVELCRMHDIVSSDGEAKKTYIGRSQGVSITHRLALPKRASASLGKVSLTAHALVWFSVRVKELSYISRKIQRGHCITENTKKQWTALMNKIAAGTGLPLIIRRISDTWAGHVESVRRHILGQDTLMLERVSELARSEAVKVKADHLEERAASWRQYVSKQLANGAAASHRLVKRDSRQCVDTATVGQGSRRTSSPQEIVDHDLVDWKKIWLRMGEGLEAPWRQAALGPVSLPKLTGRDIGRAATSFKNATSIGCDHFPPTSLAALSDPLLQAIADFLNLTEEIGHWPAEVATALVHLIPKDDGGRRPIGVLATIVRVWERSRKLVVQKWSRQNTRPYDWATQGRSAEAAAWNQSLLDEAATAEGMVSATTFIDLAKAFERVRLQDIWEAGRRYDFPLHILRLGLEAFSFARRLSYQGALTEPVLTLSAILAGGGFAQISLLLVLMGPLDRLCHTYVPRGLSLCLYVDDIALHITGNLTDVASVMASCTDRTIEMLEDELLMVVSRRQQWTTVGKAKTIATASTPLLERRLLTPMRRLGIIVARKAKHLGVQFGPGGRTKDPSGRNSRWIRNAARTARTIRLGRRLGAHVFSTGLKPAVLYGSSVAIPNATVVKHMRRAAGKVIGPMKGRSLIARLAVNLCDPCWDTIRKPISAWVDAVWDQRLPAVKMKRAWLFGHHQVMGALRPLAAAGGAAGAFFAAIRRVGWTSQSNDAVKTLDGTVLRLSEVAPKTTLRFLWDDFQIVSASSTSILEGFEHREVPTSSTGGHVVGRREGTGDHPHKHARHKGRPVPWFDPAASVLNAKWAKSQPPAAIASAASLPEGGWWPQACLFNVGLAEDPICRACGAATGDLYHRMFGCSCRREKRESDCPEWLAQQAADLKFCDPLFSRGVPLRPERPPTPPESQRLVGSPPKDGFAAKGVAYTDGALRGTIPWARRAGWAYIVVDGSEPIWGIRGTCAEPYPTVVRAELRALLEILRITTGPIRIYVDNAQVVEGVQKGAAWGSNSKRDGADLWREIWLRLDDLEGLVEVRKVKAHLTYEQVRQGIISWDLWVGNGIADFLAKAACDEASRSSPCETVHLAWKRACAFYRWAVCLAADWINDVEPSAHPLPIPAAPTREDVGDTRPRAQAQHELWRSGIQVSCRACGITASWSGPKILAAFKRACKGTMGTRCRIAGRVRGLSPGAASFDDGAILIAVLRAEGAERFFPQQGGTVPEVQSAGVEGHVATQSSMPQVFGSDHEEDPFGHAQLGFDNDDGVLPVSEPQQCPAADRPEAPHDAVALEEPQGAHRSHVLSKVGHLVWCTRCGRHAAVRLGIGLIRPCKGVATGAYPSRIARLRSRRHPISGALLDIG